MDHTNNNMKLAPIVLFVYNRPWHTKKTIKSLMDNKLSEQSNLIIFSDGPKSEYDKENVQTVRKYIKTIDGFKSVKIQENDKNNGLADSIINGVTKIIKNNGRVIVLEDDLLTSPYFLKYMNEALDFYSNAKEIFAISGYGFPITIPQDYKQDIYIDYRSSSWGWGTWLNRWSKIDWDVENFTSFKKDRNAQRLFNRSGSNLTQMLFMQMEGKIDSWAIRRTYAQFQQNSYTVFPIKSLITNIGLDGSGVHCRNSDKCSKLSVNFLPKLENGLKINIKINQQIKAINSTRFLYLHKILRLTKKILTVGYLSQTSL